MITRGLLDMYKVHHGAQGEIGEAGTWLQWRKGRGQDRRGGGRLHHLMHLAPHFH